MNKLYCCALLVFCLQSIALADTIKLKNGTTEEGDILAEDETQYTIEVQNASGTIRSTRLVKKTDVAEVIRTTPEQKAQKLLQRDYQATQSYQLDPMKSYPLAQYDEVLNNGLQRFLTNHPGSPYQKEIEVKIAQWQEERTRVAAGMIKTQGQWISAEAQASQRAQQLLARGQLLMAQKQFGNAGLLFDQVCALTNAPPDVLKSAQEMRVEAYRQWPPVLEQQKQQLDTELAACQQRLSQAQEAKIQAQEKAKAAMNAQGLQSQSTDVGSNVGGGNQKGYAGIRQLASQAGQQRTFDGQQVTRIGESGSKLAEAQTSVGTAVAAVTAAQKSVDKLTREQAALQKNLAFAQQRATALNITPEGTAATPPTNVITAVVQAPPPPAPEESKEVLQDSGSWFQRYWGFLAAGLLVTLWFISRAVR